MTMHTEGAGSTCVHRVTVVVLVWLCALVGVFVFSGVAARAAVLHPYVCQITGSSIPSVSECNGIGNVVPGGSFGNPRGVAVNSAGQVYVSDGANKVVDVFDSLGNYTSQITGTAPGAPFSQPWGVAIDGSDNAWVADVGPGLIDKFSSAGSFLAQGTGAGHWTGEYTRSVAFSSASNRLYVADSNRDDLWVLNADGSFNSDIPGSEATWGEGCCYIYTAADNSGGAGNGDIYVSSHQHGVFRIDGAGNPAGFSGVAAYISGAQLTGTPAGVFGEPTGVTVDSAGHLYVLDNGKHVVDEFDSAGIYVGQIPGGSTPSGSFGGLNGIAVNAAGNIYVADQGAPGVVDVFGPTVVLPDVTTGAVANLRARSATLTGTVNPDGAGAATCQFVWGTTTAYGQTAPCSAPVANGESPVPVQASLSGLEPDTTYHYRLRASNANGTNTGEAFQDHEFTTPLGIHGESVSNVAATSATLNATINARNVPATYYFQYGTSSGYGTSVPAPPGADVVAGEGDIEVGQHLQGLLASTTYHYRVVALSETAPGVFETFDGPDHAFTTQTVGGELALADNRVWEMVSPPNKQGASLEPMTEQSGLIAASTGGDALTYVANAPTEAAPLGDTGKIQVMSTRGPGGWGSLPIAIPHLAATGVSVGQGPEYRFFSEDLSHSVMHPFGIFNPSLSAEASEQTAFLRTNYLNGDVNDPCNSSCYRPLVTGAAGYANVPPGTVFGNQVGENERCHILCGPNFVGATPDLSHVVLSSPVGLTPGPGSEGGLYEWGGGKLTFLGGGLVGNRNSQADRHAISDDGSRVVLNGVSEGLEGLLMRDVPGGETVQLDAVQGGSGAGAVDPSFQAASSDGSKVFFTDPQRLTADAGASGETPDLYECEMVQEAGKLKCKLSDLTPPDAGEQANVLGGVLGVSDDGSWLYLVANGRLGTSAAAGTCSSVYREPGTVCNMYALHYSGTEWEKPKFVAGLSGAADSHDWQENDSGQPTRVSPDGKWLAFMSQMSLTGYDNRDVHSGQPDAEVYLYDASAGRLVCASCDPTGARPVGALYDGLHSGSGGIVGGINSWEDTKWVAANVPGWQQTGIGGTPEHYQSRYLLNGGRLFFNTADALVPQDVNNTEDVYEYEPPGVGACTAASLTFSERSGGCVGLLSSGSSPTESAFLDASESGGDVFFLTSERLLPQDFDTSLDVYSAHECSTRVPCVAAVVSPPACSTGDSCKAAPTPQPAIFGAPASATFSGAGNIAATPGASVKPKAKRLSRARKLALALKACRKKPKRKRAVCEKQARRTYAHTTKKGKR